MAKGRKPNADVVVPLTDEEYAGFNLDARARSRASELRPGDLSPPIKIIWDQLALPLCHPTRDRLNHSNVFMFVQLCHVVDRHNKLREFLELEGETYKSKTRNGHQLKSRPEVGQLNETFRQIRALASDFGMTPAADRGLDRGGQLGFRFPGEDDFT